MRNRKAQKGPGKLIAIIAGVLAVAAVIVYCLLPSKNIADEFKDKPENVAETISDETAEAEEEILPDPDLTVIADKDGLSVDGKRVDDYGLQKLITEKVKTVRVNLEDDADALTVDVVDLALARAGRFSFQLADSEGKHPTEISIPKPPPKKKPDSRLLTIDLQEVRVKLLWYGPKGMPRYSLPDGRAVLKVKGRIFHINDDKFAQMDWDALREYIKEKAKDYRPPSFEPVKTLPVIIDARKYVPSVYIERVVEILSELGIRDIKFAAPEIGY